MKEYGFTYNVYGIYQGGIVSDYGIVWAENKTHAEDLIIKQFRTEFPHYQQLSYKVHLITDLNDTEYIENGMLMRDK